MCLSKSWVPWLAWPEPRETEENGIRTKIQPGYVAAQISCSIMLPRRAWANRKGDMRKENGDWLNTYLWQLNSLWSYGSDSSGSRRGSDTRPCRPRWLTSWSACQHVLPRGRRVAPDRSRPTSVFPGRSLSRVCPHWNGENKRELRRALGKKKLRNWP